MINKSISDFLSEKEYIFWDFDGVIKDSVDAKSNAFEKLFRKFGCDVARQIRKHHEKNGGMSRFDKIPTYLKWSGQPPSQMLVDEYSVKFSKLAKQDVIESRWVPGVLEYFHNNSNKQVFFLITATPQSEIEEILEILQIDSYFQKIIGSPIRKSDAVIDLLIGKSQSIRANQVVMIGDSASDYEAALAGKIPFILRKTELNKDLQRKLNCMMINDFCDE